MNSLKQGKFVIAVPPHAAPVIEAHIQIYTGKGLLKPVNGVEGVSKYVNERLNANAAANTLDNLRKTFEETTNGSSGISRNVPTNLPFEGTYYVGVVEPVLHYTMGGLMVNPDGVVLNANNDSIANLYAAGEIMGGVHGENRLGGSSLLDCVVFGLAAANSILEASHSAPSVKMVDAIDLQDLSSLSGLVHKNEDKHSKSPKVGASSSRIHAILQNRTYDLTDFIPLHPGGPIHVKHGEDLTTRFIQAHGNDFDLLDRDTIKEISGERMEKLKRRNERRSFLKITGQKVAHGANLLVEEHGLFCIVLQQSIQSTRLLKTNKRC